MRRARASPSPPVGQAGPDKWPAPPRGLPSPGAAPQKDVEGVFSADCNRFSEAWITVPNLAYMASKILVMVRSESENGLERSRLRSGVVELLGETELIG